MGLIDKDKLVAEIERRRKEAESNCGGYKSYDEHRCDDCTVDFYNEFLEIIDTLETKEVDLDKSARNYLLNEHKSPLNEVFHQCDLKTEMQYHQDIENAYKAGFEFGLKQKEE